MLPTACPYGACKTPSVAGLGKDVPAAVVGVHPRGAACARRGVVGVIHPDELAEGIIV